MAIRTLKKTPLNACFLSPTLEYLLFANTAISGSSNLGIDKEKRHPNYVVSRTYSKHYIIIKPYQKLPSVLDELSSDKLTQNNTYQHKEAAGFGKANSWKFLAINFVQHNFDILSTIVTVKRES